MSNDKTSRPDSDSIIRAGVDTGGHTARGDSKIISSGIQPSAPTPVQKEIVLNNAKYSILKHLATSGESEVYLVEKGRQKFVLKLYYPKFKPKAGILSNLKGLSHTDIIALIDCGDYQGRFFEIVEYAEGGTLFECIPIRDAKILKQIVSETIEALNYCHTHGVIHRDIKPQNMFYRFANKTDLAIGDFGISSVLDEGFSKALSSQARTTIYAPPEIFQSIGGKTMISKEVDYYSLGITLIHLWTGREPFGELGEYGAMRMKIEGMVPIPDDLPSEIKDLIKGFITVEPSKRWGYEHVKRWLKGEKVEVHYKTFKADYKEFQFGFFDGNTLVIDNPADMADLLEKYPDTGKKHLYKHGISKWVEHVNQGLYSELESIVEDEYPKRPECRIDKGSLSP
jgi:serine/threonine protein kinase